MEESACPIFLCWAHLIYHVGDRGTSRQDGAKNEAAHFPLQRQ
jgi:hypothetical protein